MNPLRNLDPVTITDAMLSSCSIAETDYAAWSSGTTYASGGRAILTSPTSTVTLTIASPCVVTWAANGLPDDTPVVLTTSGALPTGLTAGVEYFVVNRASGTFQLSDEIGGDAIDTSGSQSGVHTATARIHKIFESAQGSNLNNPPAIDDGTYWAEVGPTNRWAMFDTKNTTRSKSTSDIEVVLLLDDLSDLVILSPVGTDAVIEVYDAPGGVLLETRTVDLVTASGRQRTEVLVLGLPTSPTAEVTVTIQGPGVRKLGGLVAGVVQTLGVGVKAAPTVRASAYSRPTPDEFGEADFNDGPWAKRMELQFTLLNEDVEEVFLSIVEVMSRPTVWIASSTATLSPLVVFGWLENDPEIVVPYERHSLCSLQILGVAYG